MIARDSRGENVGGPNRRNRIDGVEIMEASTILEGVRLATEKGWRKVEFEPESSVVLAQIKGDTTHSRLRALKGNIATIANRVEQIRCTRD